MKLYAIGFTKKSAPEPTRIAPPWAGCVGRLRRDDAGEQGLLRMGDMGGYWNFWLFARGDRGSVAHEWSGRPMPEPYIQTFQAHIMIGGT
jgi:hypothetical protein